MAGEEVVALELVVLGQAAPSRDKQARRNGCVGEEGEREIVALLLTRARKAARLFFELRHLVRRLAEVYPKVSLISVCGDRRQKIITFFQRGNTHKMEPVDFSPAATSAGATAGNPRARTSTGVPTSTPPLPLLWHLSPVHLPLDIV